MTNIIVQDGESLRTRLEAQLRFETLLADLSARFVNVPAEDVDREILEAQRRLCECLGVDGSSVWQRSADEPATMRRTHIYRARGDSPPPDELGGQDHFPWVARQVLSGKSVVIPNTGNTPPEAARDRETWAHFGVKSALALPLSTGGGPVFGVLSFDTLHREFDWPEAIVTRCRMVAQVFANALARKRSDRALRESEERFRSIATNLPGVVFQFYARDNGQWGMRYVDVHAADVCGLSVDPIDTFFDRFTACVASEHLEPWLASIREAISGVRSWHYVVRFIKPTGGEVYFRCFAQPTRTGDELIFSGMLRDITEQKRAEMAVAESEHRYRILFESAPVGIVWIGMDGLVKAANPTQARMYGYESPDELLGYYTPLFVAGNDRERAAKNMRDQLLGLEVPSRIYSLVRRDGSEFMGEVTAGLLRGPQQEVQGYLCATRDITALVKAQEDLSRTVEELSRLKEQLYTENVYLRKEVQTLQGETPIVGDSEPLRKVLAQAQQVAATESTVLILGETGTGKELLASYLHSIGRRSTKPFVTTNIAAIPGTLLESELFGREKGAYTGAMTRQIGRFEMADGGIIFLDEIGELPLETQVKLLRVLQRGEFERLGSGQTLRADVQVIAATNRNLPQLVREGRFRQDLYYRLNVFPITLPPLRDRPEDIPILVWSFVQELSERMGKPIDRVRKKDLAAIQSYDWPGNVRELRNVVERSMILAEGPELHLALPEAESEAASAESRLLREVERSHIEKVLKSTGGRIRGPHGAAEILGLKPPTLYAMMKRLGIERGK